MGIILLYGEKGLGKSSVLLELAQAFGPTARGVICPGSYTNGSKSAVYWLELGLANPKAASTGTASQGTEPEMLAREIPGFTAKPGQPSIDLSDERLLRYGKWEFNRAALASADEACLKALTEPMATLVIVDEIGPLELSYGQGYVKTLERLDELFVDRNGKQGTTPKALIVALRPDLAPTLARRWPGSGLFELTHANRASAVEAVAALISSWL